MVAQARVYFGTQFKGYYRVTQGEPPHPTIFNAVIYEVLRHWVTVMESTEDSVEPGAADTVVFGQYVQRLASYFYAGNGIIASIWLAFLQRAFETFTERFDHVDLRTNVSNKVSMDCHTFRMIGGHYTDAYGLRMMGEVHNFWERIRHRFRHPK